MLAIVESIASITFAVITMPSATQRSGWAAPLDGARLGDGIDVNLLRLRVRAHQASR
jgi:hypothetical protein